VTWDPVWPQAIEAGWGLYMTPFVGIPFTAIAFRRRVPVVATAQLYVAAGALIVLRHRSLPGAGRLWCGLLAPVTFAALWPTGRLLMGICAGPSALYLGLVSWVSHPTQASFNQTWSALCIFWDVAVIALSIRTGPAKARPQP
jgi:hypothetical protein